MKLFLKFKVDEIAACRVLEVSGEQMLGYSAWMSNPNIPIPRTTRQRMAERQNLESSEQQVEVKLTSDCTLEVFNFLLLNVNKLMKIQAKKKMFCNFYFVLTGTFV